MKTIKLKFALLIVLFFNLFASAQNAPSQAPTNQMPANTICIKDMGADDANTYFSNSQVYNFEIYKVTDINKVLESIRKDKNIEGCLGGKVIGDYTQVMISLSSKQNKAWFIAQFKKAGLNTIRINHQEVKTVEKM